ncbi:MAG: lytic transglycosylase [Desulfobulbus sp.]|nr:MAG: lytic transglycosylase [Desulfobulbus sp.]
MKKQWIRFTPCLSFSLLFFLSACSSYNTSSVSRTNHPDISLTCDNDQYRESMIIPVESEQDLEEELAGLEKLGNWKNSSGAEAQEQKGIVYDFPVTINPQVEFYIDLFQNKQKKYFKHWLERSTRYLPVIRRELAAAGLPQDLAYLAMIESGFNPSAYSHAHAAGLWQFIRGTGKIYGLRINSWVDERRDPEKATKAAAAYLKNLYERFGDWQLAVAGYNAGEGKIEKAIKKYNSRDFWELASHKYLRLETKRYVPKLIAAIIIARSPEEYGFTDLNYQQPVSYDVIDVPPRTDLNAIAISAKTTRKIIRSLNNELRKNLTPPTAGKYQVRIPAGSHDIVATNLTRLQPVFTTGFKTHKVCRGESLSRISKRYHTSMTNLLKANNLHSSKLKIGQRLRVPYRTTKYVLLDKGQAAKQYASNSTNSRRVLHKLRPGETLSSVSKRYNVPVELITQWNNIHDVRRVRAGRQLALYPGESSSAKQEPASDVITFADIKKLPAGDNGNNAQQHVADVSFYKVRIGDSLWKIARKFQVSTAQIRLWNGLINNTIKPGKKLKIKKS